MALLTLSLRWLVTISSITLTGIDLKPDTPNHDKQIKIFKTPVTRALYANGT
jgi:hypothetical protein